MSARTIEEVEADNKRLRDELTAVTLERDELKRLNAAAPDLLALVKDFEDALVSYDKNKANGISMHLSRLLHVRKILDRVEGRS